jgi:hypothetical protein
MKKMIYALMFVGVFVGVAEAQTKYYPSRSYTNVVTTGNNSTAQGVAEMMAAKNYVGHFGGNNGYEGCGSGMTQQQAYNNCCFANSGMRTVDVGYAQGRNGKWFCCRRYSR